MFPLTTILRLHQTFQNRTIPLAFRRARACVCLYGFVFALPHRFPYCNRLYALICFHIRTIPCFAPPHLPPLSKVRCCRPKKFGRLPEGLFYVPTTLPKPHPPLAPHHHTWLPCQRELDCDKAISYYKLQHSAISSTLISSLPYLSQD